MTDNLVQFVRDRLDEDAVLAVSVKRDLKLSPSNPIEFILACQDFSNAATQAAERHIARHDPARVLAEVEAKRYLLDEHQDVNDGFCGTCVDGQWGYPTHGGSSPQRYPCRTLRFLALPHADHPAYREEWRP